MRTLRFLLSNLDAFRRVFWALLLVGALDGIASFAVPILLAEFTKDPIGSHIVQRLLPPIGACLVCSLLCQWCLRAWGESLTGQFGNELRIKMFRQTERLGLDSLSHLHSGYLAGLINQVATTVGGLSSTIVWLFGHLATTMALFMLLTARESIVLAAVNAVILLLFVCVSVYLSRKIVTLADDRNRDHALVMARFIDLLTNITTVKKFGLRDWALECLGRQSSVSDRSILRFQRFHANRWLLLHAIFHLSVLATITFLLHQVERGQVSAAIFILFIAGFARVQSQAERLSETIKSLLETNAYIARLDSALKRHRIWGVRSVAAMKSIQFQSIAYRYDTSSGVISVPSFTLEAGDRVRISGASGEGKSTFLSLLANHLVPMNGQRLWNGISYSEFNDSLSQSFALVSQEAELFDLSLRENLSLGADVPDGDMEVLLCELGMGEFLGSLPEGLSTRVGEKGLRLSTGQKQRLNLARALLLKRPILLLDEPTAHLDRGSEDAVVRCLEKLPRDTTVVIVSHQESLRSLCTKHFTFEGGEMRRVG